MKRFMALYCDTSGAHQPTPDLTAEQQEQMMAPWINWEKKCGEQLVDMGAPFTPASASENGEDWTPSKNFVTGYSIVSANNLAEAQALFQGHPIYNHPGHSVEISECVPM